MEMHTLVLITALLTALYFMVGLEALFLLGEKVHPRFMPRTWSGTYAALAAWPAFILVQGWRARIGCNRRVTP